MSSTTLHVVRPCSAPSATLWQVLLDAERYPDYMAGITEVEMIETNESSRRTGWVVELKGSEMEWEQEDLIDHTRRRIAFRQTEGDLAVFEGAWSIADDPAGCTLVLDVTFDIGMPLVSRMIHPAVARALEGYATGMVDRADKAAAPSTNRVRIGFGEAGR